MKRLASIITIAVFAFGLLSNVTASEGNGNSAKEIGAFKGTVLVSTNNNVYHANWCSDLIKKGKKVKRIKALKAKDELKKTACKVCYKKPALAKK